MIRRDVDLDGVSAGLLPEGDLAGREAGGRFRTFEQADRREGQHGTAGVIGEDGRVAARPAVLDLGTVHEQGDDQVRADRADHRLDRVDPPRSSQTECREAGDVAEDAEVALPG